MDRVIHFVRDQSEGVLSLRLADFFAPCSQVMADSLDRLVPFFDRFDHLLFRQEVAESFDHQDGVFGSGEDEIELRFFHLLDRRVDDEVAVDHPHSDRADRFDERDIGEGERGGGGADCEDVGGVGVADDGGGRGEVAGVAEAEEDACFFFIVFIVFFFVDEDGVV